MVPDCGCHDVSTYESAMGTMVVFTLSCNSCCEMSVWHSQPYCHNTTTENVLLSAAIMFSGAMGSKLVVEILSSMVMV